MSGGYGSVIRLSLALVACALLAACAVAPSRPQPRPSPTIAPLAPSPVTVAPLPRTAAQREPWKHMAASFVLHDCADSTLIHAEEAMFARHPKSFERMLQQSLPLMLYVQKRLLAAGIPGEFVMLPMLESNYDPAEPSRHGDAAGMWQFMPGTARLRHVEINRHYDGRRDPIASTTAAITMLGALYHRFGDWRLVDMAYNAGPHAVAVALKKHPALGSAAIPDLPVAASTRNHLAKLMALACILRNPAHFHLQLPKPAPGNALTTITVSAGTRLRSVARRAGISEPAVQRLNPGYLDGTVPAASPRKLLLPAGAAKTWLAALATQTEKSVAQADPRSDSSRHHVLHHRVRKGESLWSIAHHFHTSVKNLKQLNHLHDDVLHPGEILRVHD